MNRVKKWLEHNATDSFCAKHICFSRKQGILKASRVRKGSVARSTVILLSSNDRSYQFMKKIGALYGNAPQRFSPNHTRSLKAHAIYKLENIQVVNSGCARWHRGSASVEIHTNEKGQLNHLAYSKVHALLDSGQVSNGLHIHF